MHSSPHHTSSATSHSADDQVHASYPVHLVVRGRRCLVVGAGNVAVRKVGGLVAAGADVTVVGPDVHPDLRTMAVTIEQRPYREWEVSDYRLAIACTDNPEVNHQVFVEGEAANVWVNSADDPDNCAFTLPSVARQGDLSVTISTNGRSPALSMWFRRQLEREFDHRTDQLLDLLAEVRAEVRTHFGTSEIKGWQAALDDGLPGLVAEGRLTEARCLLRSSLGLPNEVAA